MDLELISKLAFGLVSSLGTMALVFFNIGQTRKIRAELLEQFDKALKSKSIHSVTELFRLIHGLRMSYRDILELVNDNQCSKIIYALNRTPGLVSYRNGQFQYTNIARNALFRFFEKWLVRFNIGLLSIFTLVLLFLISVSNGNIIFFWFVLLILSSIGLALLIRQKEYNQMIKSLVNPEQEIN